MFPLSSDLVVGGVILEHGPRHDELGSFHDGEGILIAGVIRVDDLLEMDGDLRRIIGKAGAF